MPRHRGERGLEGTRPAQSASYGPEQIVSRLDRLRRVVRASLDPLATAGRPVLAGAGGAVVHAGRVRVAATRSIPDRTGSATAEERPGGGSRARSGPSADGAGREDNDSPTNPDSLMMWAVGRAQAGDHEAFGVLYDHYVDLVYRYTFYRVGNRSLAEDLTSETFTRALRRIATFSWQGRDFGAWLVTIARNLIIDHYKSARFRLEVPTADLLGAGADRPAAGPEGAVLDSLTNAALLDAVRQLGAEQQECIVLRFLEGMSVDETALAMGKKPGAVKALQYRAVRSLGRLLPDGFEA